LAPSLEESKGENDVPQLRSPNRESREIWQEENSALPLQTVWEVLQRTAE
jgi:hypothetical protein